VCKVLGIARSISSEREGKAENEKVRLGKFWVGALEDTEHGTIAGIEAGSLLAPLVEEPVWIAGRGRKLQRGSVQQRRIGSHLAYDSHLIAVLEIVAHPG
jgi:hypothetical protein